MIRCIAVDDESPALDILEDNIRRVPFLQLVKRCKSAREAGELVAREPIDLIFLDIQMPGISGTDFLRNLPNPPMVIFITAYKKYALDGFELDVLDYLIKPVSFERFLRSANKALAWHNLALAGKDSEPGYFFIHSDHAMVKVDIDQVTHIEGWKNYIKIHLTGTTHPLLTRMSMKAIEEKLPDSKYIRIHKSFIVFIDKITCIKRESIEVGKATMPLGKLYRGGFFKRINATNK
ncbi:MAG TPA: LytTR family DNA-binding domain-containing protein [Chitinophagaceae bacterium]|jgi:DNA-binding LytR/AlgR family response regulator